MVRLPNTIHMTMMFPVVATISMAAKMTDQNAFSNSGRSCGRCRFGNRHLESVSLNSSLRSRSKVSSSSSMMMLSTVNSCVLFRSQTVLTPLLRLPLASVSWNSRSVQLYRFKKFSSDISRGRRFTPPHRRPVRVYRLRVLEPGIDNVAQL